MKLLKIGLIGRTNVGKSTLFNYLTKSKHALVADYHGLTRDRQYSIVKRDKLSFILIDTGGFDPFIKQSQSKLNHTINNFIQEQTTIAINEADILLFIVDYRSGMTAIDLEIFNKMRGLLSQKPVYLVVNKTEGIEYSSAINEFCVFGIAQKFMFAISASNGENVHNMIDKILADQLIVAANNDSDHLASSTDNDSINLVSNSSLAVDQIQKSDSNQQTQADSPIKFSIIGRPNVGKSTLTNAMLNEKRMITSNIPGTTRDSVHIDFSKNGVLYTAIDTAGVRRRAKIHDKIEQLSVIKSLQSIHDSHVVLFVLDGSSDDVLVDQDIVLLQQIEIAGRALIIIINKCDCLDANQKKQIKLLLEEKVHFLSQIEVKYISAIRKFGVHELFTAINLAYQSLCAKFSTPLLTRIVKEIVSRQAPVASKGNKMYKPKIKYAHQGDTEPPVIVLHGNNLDKISSSYMRYLQRSFLIALNLKHVFLKIEYKINHDDNPYVKQNNSDKDKSKTDKKDQPHATANKNKYIVKPNNNNKK